MKRTRVSITTAVGLAVVVGFFFLPLPVGRVRQAGLIQVQPEFLTPVSVELPGILKQINVHEGDRVQQGTILAEFSNLEKELELLRRVLPAFLFLPLLKVLRFAASAYQSCSLEL